MRMRWARRSLDDCPFVLHSMVQYLVFRVAANVYINQSQYVFVRWFFNFNFRYRSVGRESGHGPYLWPWPSVSMGEKKASVQNFYNPKRIIYVDRIVGERTRGEARMVVVCLKVNKALDKPQSGFCMSVMQF